MEESKKKLFVERDGFWTEAAMLLMALAMVFRLIGSIGRWDDLHYMSTQVALPVFGGLLFLLCLLFFGRRAFWTTVIPVVAGVVFFIFRVMGLENEWEKVGWIAFYVVIVVFYTMSFSLPKLKWLLAAFLLLAMAYHIGLKDLPRLMDLENPVSFVEGMDEMSVLGAILSLLFVSFAMKTAGKAPKAAEESEAEPAPEPEEPPAEEKKLSRRERRRLERRKKEEKPAALQQMQTQPEPEEIPAEPVQSEPPVWEPQTETPLPQEPEIVPEEPVQTWEEPAQTWEEPAQTWEEPAVPQEEIPAEEIPAQELEIRAEPAEAYPLDETPEQETERTPAEEAGSDAL